MISVKMYDALNGVEKTIRHAESCAIYNGQLRVKEKGTATEFFIPEDELEHYCLFISDDVQTLDDWGDNND